MPAFIKLSLLSSIAETHSQIDMCAQVLILSEQEYWIGPFACDTLIGWCLDAIISVVEIV